MRTILKKYVETNENQCNETEDIRVIIVFACFTV